MSSELAELYRLGVTETGQKQTFKPQKGSSASRWTTFERLSSLTYLRIVYRKAAVIDDPLPENWRDLQTGVQRIFRNVGLLADVEVDLETPRGSMNVDVHAIDVRPGAWTKSDTSWSAKTGAVPYPSP